MVASSEQGRIAESSLVLKMLERLLNSRSLVLSPGTRFFDLGCGYGTLVKLLRSRQVDAYGADYYPNPLGIPDPAPQDSSFMRTIARESYHLPFESDFFDITFSTQVFEHVFDLEGTLAELWRVMKPGAIGIHIYPATWRVLEGHILVPFAGAIQSRAWIGLWMRLGMGARAPGLSCSQAIAHNYQYLCEHVAYRKVQDMKNQAKGLFKVVSFIEADYLRASTGRARLLGKADPFVPLLAYGYRYLVSRVLFFQK